MAIRGCEVNNENFDMGNANFNNMFVTKVDILIKLYVCFKIITNWWDSYGGSATNLKKIGIRIISLTTSSSRCERN